MKNAGKIFFFFININKITVPIFCFIKEFGKKFVELPKSIIFKELSFLIDSSNKFSGFKSLRKIKKC